MNNKKEKKLTPSLRFPEFEGDGAWSEKELKKLANRITDKNTDSFISRVLTNSATNGVVDQRDYFDKDIADQANLEGYSIVDEGDYVYNPRVSTSAPVGPISKNKLDKGVMSPLYTVFRFKDKKNDFFEHYFKSSHWHYYLRRVSNTGARHDRMSITIDAFEEMPLPLPPTNNEKLKIAACLSSIDEVIELEGKKLKALHNHKKGLMQNLFPAEGETLPKLRFPEFQGNDGWHYVQLNKILKEHKLKNDGNCIVHSVSVKKRVVDQIEHLGRSYAAADTSNYNLVKPFDVVYTKSPTGDFPFGIVRQSLKNCNVIVSPLYGVFTPLNNYLGYIIDAYFESSHRANSFLDPITQKGAKNTINISNTTFLSGKLYLPKNETEQKKIAECLISVDNLIEAQDKKYADLKEHKKGLMQKLFPNPEALKV